MIKSTPPELLPQIAAGTIVEVRDEEWLVSSVHETPSDGKLVRALGVSSLVRDKSASFFTNLDVVTPLLPEETTLVADESPNYRRSRLFLEAVVRKTPIPASDTRLAAANDHLLDRLEYQRRPATKALEALRPRLLIADAVGLGKTLEVGIILSELIRRGRGERILVVTPRHILEQFQHELWTRFAIPLVRLDREGIQRVQREIPAGRNPFTYYKRAIISVDTLKNVGRYRHHLEGIRWDAVVIDECHNVVNSGTLRGQLASVLAPNTEALLLASATPHNGKPESFAQLINLLDPTAIADTENYDASAYEHLYVHRHKAHSEVDQELGDEWAERMPPKVLDVDASDAENAVFAELADTWIHPADRSASPASGAGRGLFPWMLLKSFLSSHRALAQTVENRRKSLARSGSGSGLSAEQQREDDALVRLGDLTEKVTNADSAKLARLVAELKEVGVGKKSDVRVVVFSERIATLDWLADVLPKKLGLSAQQATALHARLGDNEQQQIIEDFGLADSPLRLLLASDMASEGVNLHRECHQLVHWDLPWSLITIEQRNGRIDRYGQVFSPETRSLLLIPDHPELTGEVRILARLLEKEDAAHRALGDAASLMGLHDVEAEEGAILRALRDGENIDDVIPDSPPESGFDYERLIMGQTGTKPAPESQPIGLFDSEQEFVEEALREGFDDADHELEISREDGHLLSLTPPADLVNRFKALPQSYLREQEVATRLRLTSEAHVAESALALARKSTDSMWPTVGYLTPQHPFVGWLIDKVLVTMGRNEAPVVAAKVDEPTWLAQLVYSNARGQAQIVSWLAVADSGDDLVVNDMFEAIEAAGVEASMPNTGQSVDVASLHKRREAVVEAIEKHGKKLRSEAEETISERLEVHASRLDTWRQVSADRSLNIDDRKRRARADKARTAAYEDGQAVIRSLKIEGRPLVRILGVLVPKADS